MTQSVSYQAVNGRGVVCRTFDDKNRCKAWVRDHAHLHDGLRAQAVTITTQDFYKPRQRRAFDFTIPAMA